MGSNPSAPTILKGEQMVWIIGKIKCCFCKRKTGMLYSIHSYGIYEYDMGKRIFYHPECLEIVEMDPEKHGHEMMDLALYISDMKRLNIKRTNKKIIKEHQKKVSQLHINHFERMMPKKA